MEWQTGGISEYPIETNIRHNRNSSVLGTAVGNNNCSFPAMATASTSPLGHWRDIDWRQPSVVALILANLVPIFGVVFLHWEVFPLMFLFWSENLIVGVFNVLKMLTANPSSPVSWLGKMFIIPFFCVHYGMFTFIHGIFVITLFGGGMKGRSCGKITSAGRCLAWW
jgi:Family of unknown function (DUF6498)